MTRAPCSSRRAAAAITSMTINGGTSLRPEAVTSRLALSSINELPPRCCRNCRICERSALVKSAKLTTSGHNPSFAEWGLERWGISPAMIDERPSSRRRMAPASRAVGALTAVAVALAALPVRAQEGGLPLIRDAETEQLLTDYSAPILRAAGLSHQNIHPVIINDRSFNAFVIDAKHIFVNAGALVDSKTPNQIIGVLAHESGHIAGGHLSKLRAELANAQTAAIIAMLLGVGAAVAGARSGAAVGDDVLDPVLSAPTGGAGGQGRRQIPHRHRPKR